MVNKFEHRAKNEQLEASARGLASAGESQLGSAAPRAKQSEHFQAKQVSFPAVRQTHRKLNVIWFSDTGQQLRQFHESHLEYMGTDINENLYSCRNINSFSFSHVTIVNNWSHIKQLFPKVVVVDANNSHGSVDLLLTHMGKISKNMVLFVDDHSTLWYSRLNAAQLNKK